ncbi:MAG: MBL fold metallo-hydrolase, partial [Sphaerochaetaceae bacterium]
HIVPRMYRGKGALHPTATGELGFGVSCIREYDVNIFFIRGKQHLAAIDSGYKDYPDLMEKCSKIGINPADVTELFLTHADPDHAGGLDHRCANPFKNARIFLGKLEENYLTNTWHRKKIGPIRLKNPVQIKRGYQLLEDGETVMLGDLKITSLLVPGHTLGHSAYLVNDELLFTGDSIALNQTGGYCFFDIFNLDSELNKKSLKSLKERVAGYDLKAVFTSHNGWTEDAKSAFDHVDAIPVMSKRKPFDKTAPYDCFKGQDK